ncbi:MAG: N-acetyltransferase [Sphingobacteriales bacterium]|nr:N-acetyltransferase [Sphingobacteriales bacterium]
MEILHRHHLTNGSFFVLDEFRHKNAALTYLLIDDSSMLIQHTEVRKQLEGQGIGKKLVDAAVYFARMNGYKIIPQCPYANAMFKKTPEYADVWAR